MAKPKTQGHLVTFRNDRLGGRLISLVNAVRLARTYDLPYKVRWHTAEDIARVFNDPNDFFESDFVQDKFIDMEEWNALRHELIRYNNIGKGGIDAMRKTLAQGRNILVDNSFGLIVLDGEDPDEVARQIAEVWSGFPLSPELAREMRQIQKRLGKKAMGYHIRRGDIISVRRVMNRPWPNKYVCDEVYYAHIERTIAEGATPILFSDDADTIKRFTKSYPALKAADTLFDGSAFNEGQRDALELLTMSFCKEIVAPESSGFSSTAATLGGVKHIDVTTDLTPEEALSAGERLVKRAKVVRKKPPQLREKGHLSQSLEHMCDFLRSQNRLPEAAKIIERHIKGGLNISFLYPELIEMCLELGEFERARAIGTEVQKREVHFLFDFATSTLLTGLADLALGNRAKAAERTLNAFWHSASVPMIAGAAGGMLQQGVLNSKNFLPTSEAALALWNKHPLRLGKTPALGEIIGLDTSDRYLVPVTDPITWDWLPLMRQSPPNGLGNHRHRPHYDKGFKRMGDDLTPDALSLRAIYDMHVGEEPTWLARLQNLAKAHPEDAMVQHRCSLAAHTAEDLDLALRTAEAAVEAAPGTPAHHIWRGVIRSRTQDFQGAFDDFSFAADKRFYLPRLHIRLGAMAAKLGKTDIHRKAMDAAIRIAPRDAVSRLNRADFYERSGQTDKALADLAIVMRFDQIPPRAQTLWDKCQAQSENAAA